MSDRYSVNDTMRLLGRQNLFRMVDDETDAMLDDVKEAYKGKYINYDLMIDAFMIGFIQGKRQARKKTK